MTIQNTDILLVNRGNTSYKETYDNLIPNLNSVTGKGANSDTAITINTNKITLGTDGSAEFTGNIEAAGLTDGATTKTMTEVLAGGGASVTVQSTAPTSATEGDLWWNDVDGRLFVYYTDTDGSQWVDASPEGYNNYNDTDVNSLLNTSTAATGEVLSWSGGGYNWITQEQILGNVGKALYGQVNGDGTPVFENPGWTSNKISTGKYQVTFAAEQPDTDYSVVASTAISSANGGDTIVPIANYTTTGFQVFTINNQSNSTDRPFSFIVTSANLVFPEVLGVETPAVSYEGIQGGVDQNGNKVFGEGFSVSFRGSNNYDIVWDTPFPDANYTILATSAPAGGSGTVKGDCYVQGLTAEGCTIRTGPVSGGQEKGSFVFAVMPSDLSDTKQIYGAVSRQGVTNGTQTGWTLGSFSGGSSVITFDPPLPAGQQYSVVATITDGANLYSKGNCTISTKTNESFKVGTTDASSFQTYGFDFIVTLIEPESTTFYLDPATGIRYYLNQQFTYNGTIYAAGIVTEELLVTTLGFTKVVPTARPQMDDRFYTVTGPSDAGDYTITERSLTDAKADLVLEEKRYAHELLRQTDWYVVRLAELGVATGAIPSAVTTYRAAIRSDANTRCAEINAATDISDLETIMDSGLTAWTAPLAAEYNIMGSY